ncbi:hypothetical protein MUU48_00290 [Scandinavium sp. H11S7]|uniref:hypothetical protein n=1 Tax=Scandinavium hiltneri TaxID=2926519 RepID=UPI002165C8E1|nr:hypothetical protein [Scandinavium hiltneri]MCS2155413.1 hypothetical protein [Scandinavium hiltneri]
MKRLFVFTAALVMAVSAHAAAKHNYTYTLKCGDEPKITLLDSDAFVIAVVGEGKSEVSSAFGRGVYRVVDGVNLKGLNLSVFAHVFMGKDGKVVQDMAQPVSSIDTFSLVYTGEGVAREYRLINDSGNTGCNIINFSSGNKKAEK